MEDTPSNPPTVGETMAKHKVITVLLKPSEEKKWQQRFDAVISTSFRTSVEDTIDLLFKD